MTVSHTLLGLTLVVVVGAVAWWLGETPDAASAAVAGLLATGIETVAVRVLTPALEPPFERLLKRWAMGFGLRVCGVGLVGLAVLRWPERFRPVPTALGFAAVLLPLLIGEMRLVVSRLRARR